MSHPHHPTLLHKRLPYFGRGLVRNGLVAEYPFNTGSGQTVPDVSGNGNHGTLGSTSGVDTNDPAWHPLGLSFDGVDDVITGQPSATDVYTYMGDGVYGIGRVRGHRAKNGGKAVCDLRYNRLLTTAEKTRNLQYVSSLARRRGFTGTVYKEAFPIPCTAGLMDVSITGAPVLWVFPDGTTSTASRPAKTLEANGTVWVYCSDWSDSDLTIIDNGTYSRYVGDLKDLPPSLTNYLDLARCSLITGDLADLPALTYYLDLYNCSLVTGDLADLPALTYYLGLTSCSLITGDLADLPALTNTLSLFNCSLVTGDLADLPALTNYLSLYNCPLVTGILSPTAGLKTIDLRGTGMSANDTDQTLINLAAVTTQTSGTIQTKGNRTGASDAAVATLQGKSWTVDGS